MAYLLLMVFPAVMSASCFILRKETRLVIMAAVMTMLVEIVLVILIPLDQPVRLLGMTLVLDALSRLFLIGFFCVAILAFLASLHIPHGENFVPVSLLML